MLWNQSQSRQKVLMALTGQEAERRRRLVGPRHMESGEQYDPSHVVTPPVARVWSARGEHPCLRRLIPWLYRKTARPEIALSVRRRYHRPRLRVPGTVGPIRYRCVRSGRCVVALGTDAQRHRLRPRRRHRRLAPSQRRHRRPDADRQPSRSAKQLFAARSLVAPNGTRQHPAPPFEHVAGRVVLPRAGIGRREYLVAHSANRLNWKFKNIQTTGTGRSGYTRVDLQPRAIAVDTDRQVHESVCDE